MSMSQDGKKGEGHSHFQGQITWPGENYFKFELGKGGGRVGKKKSKFALRLL